MKQMRSFIIVLSSFSMWGYGQEIAKVRTGDADKKIDMEYGEHGVRDLRKGTTLQKVNSVTWSALGSGMNNSVYAIVVNGSDVYVGGNFTTAGGNSANRIAKWNGGAWSAMGSGMNSNVNAIAMSGSDVYAGGNFTTADGNSANRIAKWNGSAWSPLGAGMNSYVNAIAVIGSDVYVGGEFTTADGNSANHIAKWNGSAWSAVGSGVNAMVDAIAIIGSDVYVGGDFTTAGGNPANYIAKWNGSAWSALGSGTNGTVLAIAVSGVDVYVGGAFTTADGNSANYIAKWNASTWSALGSGMGYWVNTIAVSSSDVYVGGAFTTAGGNSANYIAKWNSISWSALGVEAGNSVYAMTVNQNAGAMMVGGLLITGGSTTVNRIAQFTDSEDPLPVELTSFGARTEGSSVHLNWRTTTEVNNYGFEIQKRRIRNTESRSQNEDAQWTTSGFVAGAASSSAPREYSYTDKNLAAATYEYRLKQIDGYGKFKYSQSVEVEILVPYALTLSENYPNPFNPMTMLQFTVPEDQKVTLKVFDVLGREVARLFDGDAIAGRIQRAQFEGSRLASGIYFARLEYRSQKQTQKMLLLK
jgi:hypothetical protein